MLNVSAAQLSLFLARHVGFTPLAPSIVHELVYNTGISCTISYLLAKFYLRIFSRFLRTTVKKLACYHDRIIHVDARPNRLESPRRRRRESV